jgi:DNA polymerase III subunit delta'
MDELKYYFSDVIGHQKNLAYLLSDIKNSNLSHAYLFSGPAGVGKYPVAKCFIRAIKNSDKLKDDIYIIAEVPREPNQILKDTNISLKERKTNTISVDDIHELIHISNRSSLTGSKIFLIKNIERMTKSAINALLKVLEEPPSDNIVFILTTDLINLLPKTIISRCRLIHFSNVPKDETIEGIRKLGYNVDNLKRLIDVLYDSPGVILKLLNDDESFELYLRIWDRVKKLLINKDNLVDRFQYVEEISKSREQTEILIGILTCHLYKSFKEGSKNKEKVEVLEKKILELEKSREYLRMNVNPRLILENLMLLV